LSLLVFEEIVLPTNLSRPHAGFPRVREGHARGNEDTKTKSAKARDEIGPKRRIGMEGPKNEREGKGNKGNLDTKE